VLKEAITALMIVICNCDFFMLYRAYISTYLKTMECIDFAIDILLHGACVIVATIREVTPVKIRIILFE
jgi:hypothetical protein